MLQRGLNRNVINCSKRFEIFLMLKWVIERTEFQLQASWQHVLSPRMKEGIYETLAAADLTIL